MPVIPPLLGRDPLLVSAYADPSPGRRVSRVFLPLTRSDGADEISWASLAARKGETLSADTDLYELMDRSDAADIHPSGRTSVHTVRQLFGAIEASVSLGQDVIVANWIGYADKVVVGEEVEVSDDLGPWPARDFILTRTTLAHLVQVAESEGPLPIYLWTSDHRFIFSCPYYSDSLFVTSDELVADNFRAVGLEASAVEQDGPLAITGS